MEDEETIQAIVAKHEIPFLVHFTRAENIPAIMEKGLLPRTEFECEGVACTVNDELRLDGRLNAISLSIGFPNSRMLWALRQKHPGVRWSVLAVAKSVLWENDCAFCKHNAAAKRMSTAAIEELRAPGSLAGMYDDDIPGQSRADQHLKVFDPTDVQAEILAFGRISPEKIIAGVFQRPGVMEQYAGVMPGRKLVTHWDANFFSDRRYNRTNAA